MDRTEIVLVYERSTKNKHFFKEVGGTDIISSLYVNKDVFEEVPNGMKLKLVIEEVPEI